MILLIAHAMRVAGRTLPVDLRIWVACRVIVMSARLAEMAIRLAPEILPERKPS